LEKFTGRPAKNTCPDKRNGRTPQNVKGKRETISRLSPWGFHPKKVIGRQGRAKRKRRKKNEGNSKVSRETVKGDKTGIKRRGNKGTRLPREKGGKEKNRSS